MLNSHLLLFYTFLNYVKERNINKPALDIINDSKLLTEFVNELNQYANVQAGLEQVDCVPIQQNDVQQTLNKIFKKKEWWQY